jgi:hypothetical protein
MAGPQLAGEFLPVLVKLLPLLGSIVAVSSVFLIASLFRNISLTNPLLYPPLRSLNRFLAHK